ncbi:MAG: sulfite exporter TauE/SafE family protein [Natronospirillum sp.]
MNLGITDTLMLLGIVALATYAQSVTGFAFGLTVMGGAVLFNLAPVALVAILISLLSLFNCVLSLHKHYANIDKEIVFLVSISSVATLVLGVWVLEVLSTLYIEWLQIILGVAIIISSTMLVFKPRPQPQRSSRASFVLTGGLAGLMGGMFSTSGPPLVFHFYRQPLAQAVIRDTLLSVFAISSVLRLTVVGMQGAITSTLLVIAATAVPTVLLFSWLGRHYPPPLSDIAMRRGAFTLLMLSGVSLCLSAWL